MVELVRTSDPGVLSVVEALLSEAGIPYQVADRHMSVLEGSTLFVQPRVLVPHDYEAEARELLSVADLGDWLR